MSAAAPPAATPGHFNPAAVPFIVPAAIKRVRTIGAEGIEEYADDNPWVHMQLKDPFTQQQVGGCIALYMCILQWRRTVICRQHRIEAAACVPSSLAQVLSCNLLSRKQSDSSRCGLLYCMVRSSAL
jgi:hypothetical protein